MIRLARAMAIFALGIFMTRAEVLYDSTDGTLPPAQGWGYGALPGTAQLTFADGAARLDTKAIAAEHAGFSLITPGPLDRTNGFRQLRLAKLHEQS